MTDTIGGPTEHEAAGFMAGQNGWPRDACDHPQGSPEHQQWHYGYMAGQKAKAFHAVAERARQGRP